MPILDIEIVATEGGSLPPADDIAAEVAAAMGWRPAGTWVRLRRLPAADYGEGATPHPHPVFVSVLHRRLPDEAALADEAARLAACVGAACGRQPEHTHVLYLPEGAGRIAFGGHLPERDDD